MELYDGDEAGVVLVELHAGGTWRKRNRCCLCQAPSNSEGGGMWQTQSRCSLVHRTQKVELHDGDKSRCCPCRVCWTRKVELRDKGTIKLTVIETNHLNDDLWTGTHNIIYWNTQSRVNPHRLIPSSFNVVCARIMGMDGNNLRMI